MNSVYCMSLGAFMMAAVCYHKEDYGIFFAYFVFAVFSALIGGLIK